MNLPPLWMDRYQLQEELGRGGMGVVYKAWDQKLQRLVAIKMMLTTDDFVDIQRFDRECRVVASLQHPAIVPIYEYGVDPQSRPFLIMPLLDGPSLADCLRTQSLSLAQLLKFFPALLSAVDFAHSQGVLHRDIKPANVIVLQANNEEPKPVLMDFGLARKQGVKGETLTQEGAVLGTLLYMPPEQAEGSAVDARADIYALGATFYHAVTGQPPIQAGVSAYQSVRNIFEQTPKPLSKHCPELPKALEDLCLSCLAKDPAQRPGSVKDMLKVFADANQPAATASAWPRMVAAVAVLGLAFVTMAALLLVTLRVPKPGRVLITGGDDKTRLRVLGRGVSYQDWRTASDQLLPPGSYTLELRRLGVEARVPFEIKSGQQTDCVLPISAKMSWPALKLRTRLTIMAHSEFAKDADGRLVKDRALPTAVTLAMGQYRRILSWNDPVHGTQQAIQELTVKAGQDQEFLNMALEARRQTGIFKMPRGIRSDPLFFDVDNDGALDCILAIEHKQRLNVAAYSGHSAQQLWQHAGGELPSDKAQRLKKPSAGFFQGQRIVFRGEYDPVGQQGQVFAYPCAPGQKPWSFFVPMPVANPKVHRVFIVGTMAAPEDPDDRSKNNVLLWYRGRYFVLNSKRALQKVLDCRTLRQLSEFNFRNQRAARPFLGDFDGDGRASEFIQQLLRPLQGRPNQRRPSIWRVLRLKPGNKLQEVGAITAPALRVLTRARFCQSQHRVLFAGDFAGPKKRRLLLFDTKKLRLVNDWMIVAPKIDACFIEDQRTSTARLCVTHWLTPKEQAQTGMLSRLRIYNLEGRQVLQKDFPWALARVVPYRRKQQQWLLVTSHEPFPQAIILDPFHDLKPIWKSKNLRDHPLVGGSKPVLCFAVDHDHDGLDSICVITEGASFLAHLPQSPFSQSRNSSKE